MAEASSAAYFLWDWNCSLALVLRESDLRELVSMRDAINLLDQVFRLQAGGGAVNTPRKRARVDDSMLHVMGGMVSSVHAAGVKTYISTRASATFVVVLFDMVEGTVLAFIEADWLGRLRTGAASGVATKAMARADARVATVIGAGGQAETQILALDEARSLETIKVFSPTRENRESLVARLDQEVGCRLVAVDDAESAVRDSDIVTTITSAREPVFDGSWLRPGSHVNAAGSNRPTSREIDSETVSRASVVAVDDISQAREESGDLIRAVEEGVFEWDRAVPFSSIVAGGDVARPGEDDITLYESQGVGIEDVVVARFAYDRALERGYGDTIEFGSTPW